MPVVVASRSSRDEPRGLMGSLDVELTSGWWVSLRLLRALHLAFPGVYIRHRGNQLLLSDIPASDLKATATAMIAMLEEYRPTEQGTFDLPPPLVRGLATCVYVDGFEEHLTLGETYSIRQVPNLPDRVVVMRSGQVPLVGIHMFRFEVLEPKV